jgi:hypothetical protein
MRQAALLGPWRQCQPEALLRLGELTSTCVHAPNPRSQVMAEAVEDGASHASVLSEAPTGGNGRSSAADSH